jgi:hypothetical protein
MSIRTEESGVDPSLWLRQEWDIAYVGEALDDRGRAAIEFLKLRSRQIIEIGQYRPEALALSMDRSSYDVERFVQVVTVAGASNIAFEATTLGFVEVFLLLRAYVECAGSSIDVVYVEPKEYAPSAGARRSLLLTRRQFELSGEVGGFRAIPGAAILLTPHSRHRAVFFLGFEERRLDVAFDNFETLRPESCDVVFGVPAYAPGWEMNAFANNVRVLNERSVRGDLHYCGANDPAAASRILESVFNGLRNDEILLVAPIGTKPHGLAVAEFVARNRGVGILYDHPERRPGRSAGIRRWHRFAVTAGGK